jgi:hypothetical protein
MDQSFFDVFEKVRFLSDKPDQTDLHVPTLQKSVRIVAAYFSFRVGTFRFGMKAIIRNEIAKSLHAGSPSIRERSPVPCMRYYDPLADIPRIGSENGPGPSRGQKKGDHIDALKGEIPPG